ncbi:glycosyltransferase family 39 protein [bacterium]|nr:glycosyltransferase family 39 protein [bacterium]
MKKNIILILILFIIALGFRFLYMDNALWYDEACSWATATDNAGIMHNLLNVDLQHTPLYFVLLKFWIKIFGQSETAMRSLSLIFGALTVPFSYIVGNKISKNAIFSSMVCAVSPLLVLFSSEVRMYSLVVFLVLLSINFLIDYEQKGDKKSLLKLVGINILIPYTFVGGILYNLSLIICYSAYLLKNKKDKLRQYLSFEVIEFSFLIPYFILISHYAKLRSIFVISHEGILKFSHVIDAIRNFFGATIETNIYWVSDGSYNINFKFALLVIIPCIYFVIGFIKALKSENKFIKTLSTILLCNFIFAVIFAIFKVNVFTSRYILYLLPPVIMLSVIGLSEKFSVKHFKTFLILFILACGVFNVQNSFVMRKNKSLALESPAIESDELGLSTDDIVILPFGADAPYYFRSLTRPRVFNSDFHKTARNPYGLYYDSGDSKTMAGKGKYKLIFDKINEDKVFSKKYFDYFTQNVTAIVPKGRYVLLAMYDTDNNAIIDINVLRKQIKEVNEKNILDSLFKKYMCDTIAMLNMDFIFLKSYKKDNFTYYIFQKITE